MTEKSSSTLDFSEARRIHSLATSAQAFQAVELNIWGFGAPSHLREKGSGPCALATTLHHHGIGWAHIEIDSLNHPDNNVFIDELVRWSETPDLPAGSMGTSPAALLRSLRKAQLNAQWYAGNTPELSLVLITQELNQGRPVIALLNFESKGQPMRLEWHVVYGISDTHVLLKNWRETNTSMRLEHAEFKTMLQVQLPELSCSIITAQKT
jgi:hypothetical protein